MLLLVAAVFSGPAHAQSAASVGEEAGDSVLVGLRQAISPKGFTATLDLRGTPRSKLILLRNPNRVAIDLFDTVSAL
ncbi:hypothetical protein EON79_18955, partial [bacterium]